jgi:hypothetical protein
MGKYFQTSTYPLLRSASERSSIFDLNMTEYLGTKLQNRKCQSPHFHQLVNNRDYNPYKHLHIRTDISLEFNN